MLELLDLLLLLTMLVFKFSVLGGLGRGALTKDPVDLLAGRRTVLPLNVLKLWLLLVGDPAASLRDIFNTRFWSLSTLFVDWAIVPVPVKEINIPTLSTIKINSVMMMMIKVIKKSYNIRIYKVLIN